MKAAAARCCIWSESRGSRDGRKLIHLVKPLSNRGRIPVTKVGSKHLHLAAHPMYNSTSAVSRALFWPPPVPAHIRTHLPWHTFVHVIKNQLFWSCNAWKEITDWLRVALGGCSGGCPAGSICWQAWGGADMNSACRWRALSSAAHGGHLPTVGLVFHKCVHCYL